MRVEVELDWEPFGLVDRDDAGRLRFPPGLPAAAAIYWFRFTGIGVTRHYIGEAEDIVRRMAGYRAGHRRQTTNLRINRRMHEHLDALGQIEMSIARSGWAVLDGDRRALDLRRKATRLLAEAATIYAIPPGEPLENLPGIGDRAPA